MAEQVERELDKMVVPLADLKDRDIFTHSEIHAIVARRREFEYLLHRRVPRKADFLTYIQDELHLEQLRALRSKKQQVLERQQRENPDSAANREEMEAEKGTIQTHIGDIHIVQHIHLLFRRALRKYNKEDVSMYLQYADVCKQLKSWSKLSKVYAEAVQIHPHCVGLWIEAASHEFFHRGSVQSARILLQRALRVNRISDSRRELWWQSLALELHHLAKIKARRHILLQDDSTNTNPDTNKNDSGLAIAKIVYDNAIADIPDDVSFRLHFLQLCRTFPWTEPIQAHIYESLRRDFPGTPQAWIARATYLKQQSNTAISTGFATFVVPDADQGEEDNAGDNEEMARAKKKQKTAETFNNKTTSATEESTKLKDPVLALLREATQQLSTAEMYLHAIRFVWSYFQEGAGADDDDDNNDDQDEEEGKAQAQASARQNRLDFLEELLQQVEDTPSLAASPALALEQCQYWVRCQDIARATAGLQRFLLVVTTTKLNLSKETSANHDPPISTLWLRLAELKLQEDSVEAARHVLKRALQNIPVNHPDHLWILLNYFGSELMVSNSPDDKNLDDTLQQILFLAAGKSALKPHDGVVNQVDDYVAGTMSSPFNVDHVADACLKYLLHLTKVVGPLQAARQVSKMLLLQSNFASSCEGKNADDLETLSVFLDHCIQTETANLRDSKKQRGRTNTERKKDRLRLVQLYHAAIQLFEGSPGLVGKYQQGRNEIVLL